MLREVRVGKPVARWAIAESDTRSQKETSSLVRLPEVDSARKPTPISLTLSQERRLSSLKEGNLERLLRPVSVTLTQKLRLILWMLVRPSEMCFSDSSVSFWQSCKLRCSRVLAPVLG